MHTFNTQFLNDYTLNYLEAEVLDIYLFDHLVSFYEAFRIQYLKKLPALIWKDGINDKETWKSIKKKENVPTTRNLLFP